MACSCTLKCHCGVRVLVRLFHTALCLAVTGTLLWKETGLRKSLVYLENPLYGGMFLMLLLISLILYYITCLTDPGYVSISKYKRREHNLGLELDTSESETETCMMSMPSEPLAKRDRYKYRFCDYCEIQPPLRSKHCEDCSKCVRRYDHHCPWLETCIGERNHRYFWMFLLVMATLIVWTFAIVWESFITKQSWSDWIHTNIVLFLDTVVLVLGGPVVVGLLIFHTYLMFTGQTTWEAASRERITYLKYLDDQYHPFDEGVFKNIFNFLCYYKVRRWENLYAQKAKFKEDV